MASAGCSISDPWSRVVGRGPRWAVLGPGLTGCTHYAPLPRDGPGTSLTVPPVDSMVSKLFVTDSGIHPCGLGFTRFIFPPSKARE